MPIRASDFVALCCLSFGLLSACESSSRELASTNPQESKSQVLERTQPSISPTIDSNETTRVAKKEIGGDKSNDSHDKPSSEQAPPQSTPPGAGTRKLGETCSANDRCEEKLGCDGLYYEAEGKCVDEQTTRKACEVTGSEWGRWGMMQSTFCMRIMPDAEKPCTDSKQCQGKCIKRKEAAPQCQKYEKEFGCYQVLEGGGPHATLCMD